MADLQQLRRLGEGAFGEVWLVFDKALGVERAQKFIHPERVHDPSNFYREPQTLLQLRHDNVVEIYDAGTSKEGQLYIVMEYFPNGSVEDRFAGAPVPIAEALDIVIDACRGIEYAHAKGYLHRDIKPANLLMSTLNRTKVSDFGLATRVGTGLGGSPYGYLAHLAPEVLTTGQTSTGSDIYALGVTLYRLLNGDEFLSDPTLRGVEIEEAIQRGTFPNRNSFRRHVPQNLRRITRSAMAIDPSKRPASAADLRHRLEKGIPKVSFREVGTPAAGEWHGESKTHSWRVVINKTSEGFFVDVKRSKGRRRALRYGKDCVGPISKSDAFAHAQRVMNRLATHGA